MKINIYKNREFAREYFEPITSKRVLYALRFIKMLEDDLLFENAVKNIRSKCGITQKILDKGKKMSIRDILLDSLENDESKVVEYIRTVCYEYSLPFNVWMTPFYSYFKFDRMIPPFISDTVKVITERKLYKEMVNKKTSWMYPNNSVHIILDTKINKTQLLRLIDEKFLIIDKKSKKLPEDEVPQINIRNITIYKEIYDLKIRKRKSNKEIAKIINDSYERALNDDEIKIMLNRYKKALNKLHRNIQH